MKYRVVLSAEERTISKYNNVDVYRLQLGTTNNKIDAGTVIINSAWNF